MAQFLERYPRLSFYLLLSDHCESLSEQRLDVAVRVAALQKETVTARRLGYVQRAEDGSKEYPISILCQIIRATWQGITACTSRTICAPTSGVFRSRGGRSRCGSMAECARTIKRRWLMPYLPERDSTYYQPGWFKMRLMAADCIVCWLSSKHRERRSTLFFLPMDLRRARCGLLSSSLVSYIEHTGSYRPRVRLLGRRLPQGRN